MNELNLLLDFMGGYLTLYLGKQVLRTDNLELLMLLWNKTIETFKEGSFDSKNELHINLEYKRFKELTKNEKISKYMSNILISKII